MTSPSALAAIYARQSKGKERSVEEQEAASQEACAENGWTVWEVYRDLTSASRFARKARPDWIRLLADLEAGRFGVLVMWESSRGDRDPETWLGLLRRCRDHRVLIHVVSHERTYDMNRGRDWKVMADEGVDSAYESERHAERVKRAMNANGNAGRPHGLTAYGYERIYDPKTREMLEQRPKPGQAEVVQEIIRRVASAEPVIAIARDLTARGVPTPRGAPEWGRATVRSIARNLAYIGKRRWNGHDVDAIWPPLADEATFYRARAYLSGPARKTTRPGRSKHLLSYLARCGACGSKLGVYASNARPVPMYGCTGHGCVFMKQELLDSYITECVIIRMSQPDAIALRSGTSREAEEARAEAAMLRARLDECALAAANGEVSARSLSIIEAELEPRIKAAEKRAAAAMLPPVPPGAVGWEDLNREAWDEMPVSTRREVIRWLFAEIALLRKIRSGPGFDPDRVALSWRDPG